jgi:hypothetical protein
MARVDPANAAAETAERLGGKIAFPVFRDAV